MWTQASRFIGPVVAGALLGFLLMPGSLVWTVLAGATIALVAIRYAVPATAVRNCEQDQVAVERRRLQ